MLSKYYQNRDIVRSIYTLIEKCLVYRMSLSVLMIPVEKCGHCLYKSKIFEQILFILQFNDEFILSRTLYLLSLMANYRISFPSVSIPSLCQLLHLLLPHPAPHCQASLDL